MIATGNMGDIVSSGELNDGDVLIGFMWERERRVMNEDQNNTSPKVALTESRVLTKSSTLT
jgi:hypothetical protein